jgi:beta-N-acetylhexosaminidase
MKGGAAAMGAAEKIGQRVVAGFSGTRVPEELGYLVKKYKVGNVILFRENLESPAQARELCGAIQELIRGETGFPAFIAIDQEGGVVTRLPRGMINVPGAMALAMTGDPGAVYEAARISVRELRRIGVNLNLAPVLDINSNPANPVIGVRSFGAAAPIVSRFGEAAIRAYRDEQFLCCGKHFPGHGDTGVDSHLTLPVVDRPLGELEERELAAFRDAVAGGIPALMTSHILFPPLEPRRIPATMSRTIITGLLREKMGFSGLILSDAMEMRAIADFYGTPQGCVEAAGAGVDLIFVCHDPLLMEESLLALARAYQEGRYDQAEFDASVERVLRFKEGYAGSGSAAGAAGADAALNAPDEALVRQNAALMGRTIMAVESPGPFPALGGAPLFLGPRAAPSSPAMNREDQPPSFAAFFDGFSGGRGLEISLNPGPEEIGRVREQAAGASALVLALLNAPANRGQLDLSHALAAAARDRGIPLALVSLRNPGDLREAAADYKLAAWEYSEASLNALGPVFRGEYSPAAPAFALI